MLGLHVGILLRRSPIFRHQETRKHMYRLAMELGLVKLPVFDGDDEDYTLE